MKRCIVNELQRMRMSQGKTFGSVTCVRVQEKSISVSLWDQSSSLGKTSGHLEEHLKDECER